MGIDYPQAHENILRAFVTLWQQSLGLSSCTLSLNRSAPSVRESRPADLGQFRRVIFL